jgi:transposase
MKTCPRCAAPAAWTLGDGRFKCRCCGKRYSWRSVWDSARLTESAKLSLVQAFVDGVPAYRQRFRSDVCVGSCERFYRLIRACCIRQGALSHDSLQIAPCYSALFPHTRTYMRGWATSSHVMLIGIAERSGQIRISAPLEDVDDILRLLRERSAVGSVVCMPDGRAYASLQVQGDSILIPRLAGTGLQMQPAEAFWSYVRERLTAFRKIPVKFFPLYAGEASFCFNERDRDLVAILISLAQSTSIAEVRRVFAEIAARWARPELDLSEPAEWGEVQPCAS